MSAADLRILEASRLAADESALTGESVPIGKQVEAVDEATEPVERRCMLFKGTALTRGSAWAVVVAIGMATELGRIASLAEGAGAEETPLEKRLQHLGYRLIWLTLIIAALVSIAGLIAQKELLTMIETAIALAVAATPEGLPMVATLGLARGMWRMLRRNVLINRLSAVETLGSTTVIFTNKTGTLTENRMSVTQILFAADDQGRFKAIQVKPDKRGNGHFQGPEGPAEPAQDSLLNEILETGVLCNNADLGIDDHGGMRSVGDPLEIALLRAGHLAGLRRDHLLESNPETREEAFDHDVKMMATFHEHLDGWRVAVKESPEAVLKASSRVGLGQEKRPLNAKARGAWLSHSSEWLPKACACWLWPPKPPTACRPIPTKNSPFWG